MPWKNSVAVAGGANSNEFSRASPSYGDPSSAETSDVSDIWQYGSAINIKIYQPDLNKIYLNDRLIRIANIKRAKGTEINHWGKFYYNNQILLEELAINISKQDRNWISATSKKREFSDQLNEVNKLLEKVR